MRAPYLQTLAAALRRASGALNAVAQWSAVGFLCLMVLMVTVQIVARYAFRDAPAWTEEAARYAMVWSALLAATSTFYSKTDPVLVNMADSKSRLLRMSTRWARFICVIVFTGPLLYFSIGMLSRSSLRETESLGINLAFVTVIVPIFAVIVLFHALAQLVEVERSTQAAERD